MQFFPISFKNDKETYKLTVQLGNKRIFTTSEFSLFARKNKFYADKFWNRFGNEFDGRNKRVKRKRQREEQSFKGRLRKRRKKKQFIY